MGLFDLLSRTVACPACGQPGARRSLFGNITCPNASCQYFDPDLMYRREEARQLAALEQADAASSTRQYRNPRTGATVRRPTPPAGDFQPGACRIEIQYTNFRGQQKTFVGDWRTLRQRGKHFSLQVAPTGRRIALDRDRIGNVEEVEAAARRCPDPKERQVLTHHARRRTTSARCEELRAKYPDWSPPDR